MNLFEGCWQRILRAEFHGKALTKLWDGFNTNEAYTTSVDIKDDGTGEVFITPRQRDWVVPFSLEFGELIYQLRAALDACIYESAVLKSGQDPPPDEDALQFPIQTTPKKFKNASRQIAPLADECRAFIESIQPYQTTFVNANVSDRQWFINRGLGMLNDLAKKDRHRRLHVLGSVPTGGEIRFGFPEASGMSVEYASFEGTDILEHKSKIGAFRIRNFSRQYDIKMELKLTFEIAVEKILFTGLTTDAFITQLQSMIYSVSGVITWFERFHGVAY